MRVGIGMALTARQPLSLVARAIGILRKYGTDAHVYLPGIGTVSGLTAGNYLDSAGTTAASVDNPVGLSLDALQAMTLGAELLSQSNATLRNDVSPVFDAFSIATFSNATDKVSVGYDSTTIPVIAGNSYNISISINVSTGLANLSLRSGGVLGSAVASTSNYGAGAATWSTIFAATVTENLTLRVSSSTGSGATSVTLGTRSIKQIPGIHATQATTANKCLLRLTGGKYNWVFDTTDLLTATFPAGNESVTVIDSFSTGQVTNTGVNVVGAYSMGPSVTLYGRMIIKGSISASDLLVLQRFANSWAGL